VSQTRKNIDKKLKARVALDAIRGEKTIAMIVSEYEVQPNQVSLWNA